MKQITPIPPKKPTNKQPKQVVIVLSPTAQVIVACVFITSMVIVLSLSYTRNPSITPIVVTAQPPAAVPELIVPVGVTLQKYHEEMMKDPVYQGGVVVGTMDGIKVIIPPTPSTPVFNDLGTPIFFSGLPVPIDLTAEPMDVPPPMEFGTMSPID